MKKNLHLIAVILCFLLSPGWLLAQEKTITGRVTDAKLSPLSRLAFPLIILPLVPLQMRMEHSLCQHLPEQKLL